MRDLLRRPAILIGIGVLATAGLIIGARAVTASLLDSGATPVGAGASAGDANLGITTTTDARKIPDQTSSSATAATTATTTTVGTSPTTAPVNPAPPGLLETLDADGVVVGESVITPYQPDDFRDRLTVLAGAIMDFPSFPTEAAPGDTSSGPGNGLADRPDVTNGEVAPLPRAFAVGVMAEAESHFAVIRVGIDAGPEGLSDLVVDFGDGQALEVSQGRIDQVGDIGTIEIVHRYEPTLTPQPQVVTATATDGAGNTKAASASFETQALFLVAYSPLTVTALDDCDLFGKGDFELEWNNDGRDRRTRFDLGKGESYVEEEFRVGIDARYGDKVEFSISITELDPVALQILRFVSGAYMDSGFIGPTTDPFVEAMQLGTVEVPISIQRENYEECDTRLDLSVTLGLSEREPR